LPEQARVAGSNRVQITPDLLALEEKTLEQAYVARLNTASDKRRKALRSQVVATFVIAIFAFVMLELSLNLKGFPAKGLFSDGIHFATIDEADATVIVAGLLTVVAALNIALSSWRDSPAQVEPEDLAAGLIWADHLEYVTGLAAVLAFATALLRVPGLSEENLPLTLFLLGLGAASIVLSSAVFEWKSHKLPRQWREQEGIDRLDRYIKEWNQQLTNAIWSPRKAYTRGIWFIVSIGIAGALTVVAIALNGGGHVDDFWAGIQGLLLRSIVIMLSMPVLIWLTVKSWVAAKQRPEDRGIARPLRWPYIILMALSPLAIASNTAVVPTVIWAIIGAIEFFSLILPLALMFLARVLGIGPARFALHLRAADGERTLSKMRDSLTEID
jgi:hypothetical protein